MIVGRTETPEEKTVEPGRAGGSSAPGRARARPGRAPEARLGLLVCVGFLCLLDDSFVSCLFEALHI